MGLTHHSRGHLVTSSSLWRCSGMMLPGCQCTRLTRTSRRWCRRCALAAHEVARALFRDLPPEWKEQGNRPCIQPLVPITKGTLWKRKRNPRKPKFMNRLAR